MFNPSHLDPRFKEKIKNLIFMFVLLFGKGFMKAIKALIKPFEVPQRSVKIKIKGNFYFEFFF